MTVPIPSATTVAPTMFAEKLFNSRELSGHATISLADNAAHTFVINTSATSVMDGVYEIYSAGTVDVGARFTVTGGDTVTLLVDYGTDFVVNAVVTDNKINIDCTTAGLVITNRLAAAQTLYVAKIF